MSRRRVPRRFQASLSALAAAALAAGPAFAQTTRNNIGPQVTVGGYGAAQACARASAERRADAVALAACDRALTQEPLPRPDRRATLFHRGVVRLNADDAAGALADFDAALAIRRDGDTELNRAAALAALGDYGSAVAAVTSALANGVREPHLAYFNRGAAREALGDLRGALEDYTTALQIRPDWAQAEAEVGRFAQARRDRLARVLGREAPVGASASAAR
ncbi:MAG: tetratricopeptide repeat protein [Hyphomonadaceae bacterium]|nr:tetratricopeptide repeat protein [Hyphomonadaceae bacterium]